MHLSLPKRFPMLILPSSVCWSLQCLISAMTQGGGGGHLFRLSCSVVGREEDCKQMSLACVGSARSVSVTLGLPRSRRLCFPSLHCSGSRLLCRELSEVGPRLYVLPRSEPLRFRFLATPQRRRLSWACVLCPSQVRAAQVTRCLVSAVTPSWRVHLIASPIPAAWFSGWTMGVPSQVCRVSLLGSSSLVATLLVDVNRPESQEVLVTMKPACSLVEDAISGAMIAPFRLWLSLTCLYLAGDEPV